MTSEYIRLSKDEVTYVQKVFLQSQLEMIDVMKRHRNFLKARNEEFMLKITLKNKVEEVMKNIELLEKVLPKTSIKIKKSNESASIEYDNENLSLEQEIQLIKKKLEKLH